MLLLPTMLLKCKYNYRVLDTFIRTTMFASKKFKLDLHSLNLNLYSPKIKELDTLEQEPFYLKFNIGKRLQNKHGSKILICCRVVKYGMIILSKKMCETSIRSTHKSIAKSFQSKK